MSLYPFFAQARAFYILLAYGHATSEVDYSLALMFMMGTLGLVVVYISSLDMTLEAMAKYTWEQLQLLYLSSIAGSDTSQELSHHILDEKENSMAYDDVRYCVMFD